MWGKEADILTFLATYIDDYWKKKENKTEKGDTDVLK